jgi:poly-beta-1,6-N-acetyl-D-glucosamine biosynthesis protein PgaD
METLIINKRHELPRTKRWAWDAITIVLWGVFIYLWKPVFHIFYRIVTLGAPPDEISDWIFGEIHSVTFEHGIEMLIGTPIVLFILSRLNRHKAPTEHLIYHNDDYAAYFKLDNKALEASNKSQLVTVHYDEHGHITAIDNHITLK